MRLSSCFLIRAAAFSAAVLNLLAVFYFGVRPWYQRWGATHAEWEQRLPGDDVVAQPRANTGSTRAITIRAAHQDVWPWIAQLGQDRAGFYSFELLEDLVGCQMPDSGDRIHTEFQSWAPGDKLWMYPPHRLDGLGHAALVRHEPGRALVFATRQIGTPPDQPYDGTWAFVLEPVDAQTTRLLVRGRVGGTRGPFARAFDTLVFEPIHFVMERRMMEGIKDLAEGRRTSQVSLVAQPLMWMLLFVLAVVLFVRGLRGQRWPEALALFITTCVAFQYLTFMQPPAVLGVALTVALWWLSFLPAIEGLARRQVTWVAAEREPLRKGRV